MLSLGANIFSSEWTDQVLRLKEELMISKEECALEGLCICSHDNYVLLVNHYSAL